MGDISFWFYEQHAPGTFMGVRIKSVLYQERTRFQELAIVETEDFGRALVLDGALQTTERDEKFYHEMLAHVPLCAHPSPQRVLIIGGGDGGLVREVLKHPSVEHVTMVEIDPAVVEACRKYLPALSCGLDDERVHLVFEDGIAYVARSAPESFDLILVDSTDPGGSSTGLFSSSFYRECHRVLNASGYLACQTEEPFFRPQAMQDAYRAVAGIFPLTRLFISAVPVYSAWFWTFTIGSKAGLDPVQIRSAPPAGTIYYTPEVHRAAFALPPFIRNLL